MSRFQRSGGRRGASLVGMLVSLVIMCLIGWILYVKMDPHETDRAPTRPGGATTRLGQGLEKGKEVDCRNNLNQIRTAISMEKMNDTDGSPPPQTLQELSKDGIGPQMLSCPVSHQPYKYDPQTGQVICPTVGHQGF